MRAVLKRLTVLVSAVKLGRKLRGRLVQDRVVSEYLANHEVRKLQIGAGENLMEGWLSSDLEPKSPEFLYLDATKTFPIEDDSFDYVWSEHQFEHIGYLDGLAMLRECHRVLKPGGRLRIATPDLEVQTRLIGSELDDDQRHYVTFMVDTFLPEYVASGSGRRHPSFVVNNAFLAWDHRFLYDKETLTDSLTQAGFGQFTFHRPLESDDPELQGIERHGGGRGGEAINGFETLVVEAVKP